MLEDDIKMDVKEGGSKCRLNLFSSGYGAKTVLANTVIFNQFSNYTLLKAFAAWSSLYNKADHEGVHTSVGG
jgi:hypothetical protein